jgi:hypothetical protein
MKQIKSCTSPYILKTHSDPGDVSENTMRVRKIRACLL